MKKLFLLISIPMIHLTWGAWATTCPVPELPKSVQELQVRSEERIRVFANKKIIASRADETLSKLIAAKSPVITGWLARQGVDKSEDQIVHSWRDQYARQFMIGQYPHKEAALNAEIEKLIDSINELLVKKDFQKRIQETFKRSQEASIKAVQQFPISAATQKLIIRRISEVKLYWMKNLKDSKFRKMPLEFLEWGIAYDPTTNEINMGFQSIYYPNEESYLAVFAHELGHSIDSCRWSGYLDGPWPFESVGECLRSPGSVEAKKRDDSKLDLLLKQADPVVKELLTSLKKNPTCNKLEYPPNGLQNDQLPEAFADWFSTEALANLKVEVAEPALIRADLCVAKTLQPGSSYPGNEARRDRIYFAHPKFKSLRKDANPTYCGMEKPKTS